MVLAALAGKPLTGRGIGPAMRARLARLGVADLRTLLLHLPRTWQDRRSFVRPQEVASGMTVALQGRVVSHVRQPVRGGRILLRIRLDCDGFPVELVCFNREFLARSWPSGTVLSVWGTFERDITGLSASSFEALPADDPQHRIEFGRLVPVYPLTEGLTQRIIRRLVDENLRLVPSAGHDLPEYLVAKRRMRSMHELLAGAHFPHTEEEGLFAREELAYIELLLFQAGVLSRRARLGRTDKPHAYCAADVRDEAEQAFRFRLTDGQAGAWEVVRRSLAAPEPMQVLLLGDVGSGKTAVAALAILLAVRSGLQVALAAPTVILARQLAARMGEYLEPLGVRTAFLHGGLAPDQRRRTLARIAGHEVDLVSGTHALFQDDVVFKRLGLVVIDEQHRFGVNQRQALRDKGLHADYLAMSATPIPRTLALAMYGDYETARISGLPGGRPPVSTLWVRTQAGLDEALRDVEERIGRGEQACFVCPAIGADEADSVRAATATWKRYAKTSLASRGIALLHGRMDDNEKTRVMDDFISGRVGLLVATSVIEVGIDNPGLSCIVIFEAQCFGLSQLHQLRGRVGRGRLPSVCYLVTQGQGAEESGARMQVLLESSDGFRIAEADLALRGPGDFLGVAQTGLPEFSVADFSRDGKMLELARKDAALILGHDPLLESPHNASLRQGLGEGRVE